MTTNLRVTIVQASLHWEAPAENLQKFSTLLEPISGKTDLILLPEMFTSGFTMAPEKVAESMNGPSVKWMLKWAEKSGAALAGSLVIEEKGDYFNRLIWANPDGTIHHYDKKHLFTLAGENKSYQPGDKRLIVDYKGWKICPMICYDLRFPVWARNDQEYDLLFFVANWPSPRVHHWDHLLMGRAIENQSYVIGVNRCGGDNNRHHYSGHSSIVDYNGEVLIKISDQEAVFTASLSKKALADFRKRLNFLSDRDRFQILT